LDRQEVKAQPDLLDFLVLPAHLADQDLLGHPEAQEFQADQVLKDLQVHLVNQETRDQLEHPDLLVLLDQLDHQAMLDLLVRLDLLELLEIRARQDRPGHPGHLV